MYAAMAGLGGHNAVVVEKLLCRVVTLACAGWVGLVLFAGGPAWARQKREGLSALNDVPIVFDGKVEDQFGDGVGGATIAASVRICNGFKSTVERFSVASDASGFFHIDHGKGESLGLVPSKTGYVLAMPSTYFKYSHMYPDRFTPDPHNPVTIKMWKLQGAEPLVKIDQRHNFQQTGAPLILTFWQERSFRRGVTSES